MAIAINPRQPEKKTSIPFIAIIIFGTVVLPSIFFLVLLLTSSGHEDTSIDLTGQIFHYTLRIPLKSASTSTSKSGGVEASCTVEGSSITACPSPVMAMINLENQALANWTHHRNPEFSHLFSAGRIAFGEKNVTTNYLISFVDIAGERVKDLFAKREEKIGKYFNGAYCHLHLSSENQGRGVPDCVQNSDEMIAQNLHEFRRDEKIFGVAKLELETKVRQSAEYPGDLEVIRSVRTLKEGWSMAHFSANLISFEEQRKAMCDCPNTYKGDKGKDLSGICLKIAKVREEFHPFLSKDSRFCFPEPAF